MSVLRWRATDEEQSQGGRESDAHRSQLRRPDSLEGHVQEHHGEQEDERDEEDRAEHPMPATALEDGP